MGTKLIRRLPQGIAGLAGGVSLLALMMAAQKPAWAQTTTKITTEEVVVTAERHREKLKDVPEQVTRISAESLAQIATAGEDIRMLSARVPSLNIESSFGRTFPRLYIRGLGNSDYYANSSQPVSVVFDDVVLESPFLKSFPMFDVDDIEVLAGPQGTLFGRNTPAGVVKVVSKAPSDKFEASTDDSWGTYNTINTTDVLNVPLVPGLLDSRLAIEEQHRDNWVNNNYHPVGQTYYYPTTEHTEGYDDTAGRLEFLYKPSSDISAELTFDARRLIGSPRLFRANIIQPTSNALVSGFKPGDAYFNGVNVQYLNTEGTHFNASDNLGPVTASLISSYDAGKVTSNGDIDGGVAPNNPADTGGYDVETGGPTKVWQGTDELRLATNGLGRFFDQGGVYFFEEHINIFNLTYNTQPDPYTPDNNVMEHQSDDEVGFYDSATYQLTDPFKIGAGIRYTVDDKHYSDYNYDIGAAPYPGAFAANGGGNVNSHGSKVTWDTNGDYAVNPDTNLYYRVATGYMPTAMHYNSGDFATPQVARPSTTLSFEAGIKGNALDSAVNYTFDGYAWDTNNMELTAVGGSSGDEVTILNAKKVIGRGLEAQLDARPTDQITLHGAASYNYTQIEQSGLTTEGCGGGCEMINSPASNGNYNINGNPLPQAPRYVLDGSARYDIPYQGDKDIYLSTDWSWRSGVDFFLYKSVNFDGPPLLQGGLRVGLVDYAKNYEVAIYARNILNTVVATGAIDFSNIEGFINDPRIVGAEVKKSF